VTINLCECMSQVHFLSIGVFSSRVILLLLRVSVCISEHHFYDFERENKVLKELEEFLYTIKVKVKIL